LLLNLFLLQVLTNSESSPVHSNSYVFLLGFALEDERFFEQAIRCHALGIFEVTEFAPPQSVN
jgi:hypothetical protein